ncbi:hypothetical protein BD410DRAFT_823878 [Rickenella mellea]|uniref:Uncharacterized protein n=1 Tax=Rickenella mellea TaxID=50990 RepID=A0A4R5XFH7_9AGAM|nr:hypothetical protein BD410DRAFT_823878 [Rickenella mellea]
MTTVNNADTTNTIIGFETFENILRFRYGVHHTGEIQWLNLKLEVANLDTENWKATCRVFGVSEDSNDHSVKSNGQKDRVIKFVDCVLDNTQPISRDLYDLHPSHPRNVVENRNQNIMVTPHAFDAGWYCIAVQNDTVTQWHLFVDNPTTAVACYRRSYSSVSEIASDFLRAGIRFSTRKYGPYLPPKPGPHIQCPNILGYRPKHYKPNHVDYAAYEAARNAFLVHPRARAALLKGGIIWRLTIEFLRDDPVLWDQVLRGPTGDLKHSHAWCTEKGTALWDDELSDDELDLISGVYRVFTGCEHWYQARLERIRDGTAQLRNGKEWVNSLKFTKKTLQFAKAYDDEAWKYLSGLPVR